MRYGSYSAPGFTPACRDSKIARALSIVGTSPDAISAKSDLLTRSETFEIRKKVFMLDLLKFAIFVGSSFSKAADASASTIHRQWSGQTDPTD